MLSKKQEELREFLFCAHYRSPIGSDEELLTAMTLADLYEEADMGFFAALWRALVKKIEDKRRK
jgi:hypothetical protein